LQWRAISVSASGKYQTAVYGNPNSALSNGIVASSNFGDTWNTRDQLAGRAWRSVSVSASGQYQIAVVFTGSIWVSTDFGFEFYPIKNTSTSWRATSISETGQYQVAAESSGKIWVSTNFGMEWFSKTNNNTWSSVSVSSSGQYIIATPGNWRQAIRSVSNINAIGDTSAGVIMSTYDPDLLKVLQNVQVLNLLKN
jgi:hypothetical protein